VSGRGVPAAPGTITPILLSKEEEGRLEHRIIVLSYGSHIVAIRSQSHIYFVHHETLMVLFQNRPTSCGEHAFRVYKQPIMSHGDRTLVTPPVRSAQPQGLQTLKYTPCPCHRRLLYNLLCHHTQCHCLLTLAYRAFLLLYRVSAL